jgi:DNA-binding IclR family transcriptional regulator
MARGEHALVRSLQRGLQLLNTVGELGPVSAKQVAHRTSTPLATAYHLLRTLAHDGYIVRLSDGSYILGERLGRVADATSAAESPGDSGSSRPLRTGSGSGVRTALFSS